MIDDYELLGQNIRKIRKSKGMTLRELGDKLGGMAFSNLARYERGEVKMIPISMIKKLALALDVSPTDLIGSVENNNKLSGLLDLLNEDELSKVEEYIIYLIKNRELK